MGVEEGTGVGVDAGAPSGADAVPAASGVGGSVGLPEPKKRLPARKIAAELGVSKRIVLTWFNRNPAMVVTTRGHGGETKLAAIEDVEAWLRQQGLDVPRQGGRSGGRSPRGRSEAGGDGDADLFGERARAVALELSGTLDFSNEIVRIRRLANKWLSDAEGGADLSEAEKDRLASTLKKMVGELRQLETQRAEILERRREVLPRSDAAGMLASLAGVVASDLSALAADLTRAVVRAIAEQVPPERMGAVERLVSVAARDACDAALSRLADAVEPRRAQLRAPAADAPGPMGSVGVAA